MWRVDYVVWRVDYIQGNIWEIYIYERVLVILFQEQITIISWNSILSLFSKAYDAANAAKHNVPYKNTYTIAIKGFELCFLTFQFYRQVKYAHEKLLPLNINKWTYEKLEHLDV